MLIILTQQHGEPSSHDTCEEESVHDEGNKYAIYDAEQLTTLGELIAFCFSRVPM
jgi:hypothetical protein